MRISYAFRHSEWSMKRKLFGYMFLLAILLLFALMSGLFLLGRFDSTKKNTYEALDIQMEVFEKDIFSHFDRLAAASIQLSLDTTELLEQYLVEHQISFQDLNNKEFEIAQFQEALIDPLRQKLLQENCSGVFVMLNATINDTLTDADQSRTGLYLQQNGYKTTDDSILLYRGLSEIGKRHNILPHRKWRLEFRTDIFPNYEEILSCADALSPEKAYLLTDRFTLPGTSESACLMAVPIVGSDGTFYGICGYELSASYFMAYHGQPTNIPHLSCLLTPDGGQSLTPEAGLSCGVANSYYYPPKEGLNIQKADHGLLRFSGNKSAYIGITREILLSPNNEPHTLTVMIPKSDYDRAATKTLLQNLILWSLLLFFAVSCCLYFSRRYLSPILKGLEQIKSENRKKSRSTVPEINDLFIFLAEQDQKHEDSLNTLLQEKESVQNEKERLQLKYEQALAVYGKAQNEYTKAQQALEATKMELDRLAYSRKTEIDPADYENFLMGIQTLTKTERQIFEWYLEGKTAEEILKLSNTQKGTLKFHNHNILNKLGVPSRKQMLRFATLMKQQEQKGDTI